MAHLIDNSKGFNAFIANGAPAWHGLGTLTQDAISAQDALTKAGLDFNVLKLPNIHILPDGEQLISDDSFFTVRTDTKPNKVLGSRLGKDYTVMQNIEALNVVDEILQAGTATIETAGAIDEGRKVFICLKVNQDIIVGTGDNVKQFVLIATAHDGGMSTIAMPTNIRVVCNNTLTAALRGSKDKIRIRHTGRAAERLQEAAKVLHLMHDKAEENTEHYNTMLNTILTPQQMADYFGNVFYSRDEVKALQDGKKAAEVVSKQKQNVMQEVVNFARTGTGQALTLNNGNLTAWTAYNAVTGYMSRKKYSNANDRANSMLFGTAADTIEAAGVLALNPAKIQPLSRQNFGNINFN